MLTVLCARVRPEELFEVPKAQLKGDAGLDLTVSRYAMVGPGQVAHLSTNVAVSLPQGYYGLVLPRSSTMWRKGLHVSPGVIDNGYRGEVMIVIRNETDRLVQVQAGDRVAQLLILPLFSGRVLEAKVLDKGVRGDAGFGSTGGYSGD